MKRRLAVAMLACAGCIHGDVVAVNAKAVSTDAFAMTWEEGSSGGRARLRLAAKLLVLELKPVGNVSPATSMLITRQLLARLEEIQDVKAVSIEDVDTLLGVERKRDALGCDSTICASEIGGALGTDHVVYGQVGRLGEQYNVNLTAVATKTGAVSARVSVLMPAEDDVLASRVPSLARELVAKIAGSAK